MYLAVLDKSTKGKCFLLCTCTQHSWVVNGEQSANCSQLCRFRYYKGSLRKAALASFSKFWPSQLPHKCHTWTLLRSVTQEFTKLLVFLFFSKQKQLSETTWIRNWTLGNTINTKIKDRSEYSKYLLNTPIYWAPWCHVLRGVLGKERYFWYQNNKT